MSVSAQLAIIVRFKGRFLSAVTRIEESRQLSRKFWSQALSENGESFFTVSGTEATAKAERQLKSSTASFGN